MGCSVFGLSPLYVARISIRIPCVEAHLDVNYTGMPVLPCQIFHLYHAHSIQLDQPICRIHRFRRKVEYEPENCHWFLACERIKFSKMAKQSAPSNMRQVKALTAEGNGSQQGGVAD